MENKLIEAIRKILIATVLPLKEKRDNFLKKLRLSLAYRISMNYLKLLVIYGIVFFLGFGILYMWEEKNGYDEFANAIITELEREYEKIGDVSSKNAKPMEDTYLRFSDLGITFSVTDCESGETVYSNHGDYGSSKRYFHRIIMDNKNLGRIFYMEEVIPCKMGVKEYEAHFIYNMTESYQKLLRLSLKLLILYAVILYFIMKSGKKGDVKIFEPIRYMTDAANRLTINNLHSERLNVEGTKNEFKDLAAVINEMLDRIETSYESQKQFVSDASHELRTPIAVIQGYANLLNRWGTKDQAVLLESIDAIQNESRSMQDLVEKLLFLSRHDKKTLKLNKKRFNMRPVVEDMVKETKLVAANRIIEVPKLEDVMVYGDKQSLKQAIRIFIDNAIKYSRDGDTISISCENRENDCIICVADTGLGMTRKDVDHIFDRFYRSDDVRNKNISGHGLGLSLAKLIILGHVGKIKVRTQYTKGTSFTVTLPHRDFY